MADDSESRDDNMSQPAPHQQAAAPALAPALAPAPAAEPAPAHPDPLPRAAHPHPDPDPHAARPDHHPLPHAARPDPHPQEIANTAHPVAGPLPAAQTAPDTDSLAVPAKRKRDNAGESDVEEDRDVEMGEADGLPASAPGTGTGTGTGTPAPVPAPTPIPTPAALTAIATATSSKIPAAIASVTTELVKNYFDVLTSLDVEPPILKRLLPHLESHNEPQAKRQKSAEPPSTKSISDKFLGDAYATIDDVAADVVSAVTASLAELASKPSDASSQAEARQQTARLTEFRDKALELVRRESMYPKTWSERASGQLDSQTASERSSAVLSIVGYAPLERRLFSSLPLSQDLDLSAVDLPPGVSITRVVPSNPQDPSQTLGELFAPPRSLPPLQPPKQPKTLAKGNRLDFYHPHPTDSSRYRSNTYFNTRLSTGHYLDYSHATPWWQNKTKQRERAQSLAGKKPLSSELEASEIDSLFRGAFSSFAPCRDDSSAVLPASLAGKLWWQRVGQRNFQKMIEAEYYGGGAAAAAGAGAGATDSLEADKQKTPEIDEAALQEALDNWDDAVIDPSLEDVMGAKRSEQDKEADEILDEVTDLIETLASYQRIRNLSLPNSQNRQTSDPVAGDMLANAGPQPSEEEQATYHMLKAQLALIIKTLPPYAVAKLNGDQLDDLLISTKMMVQTDQYRGTMEEDEAGLQARIKAQQQAAHAAQANARPSPQRTPSVTSVPYPQQYQTPQQYGTPSRAPAPHPQYYRNTAAPNYQQPRSAGPPPPMPPHTPRNQPNQYTRANGYPNQYATQLAKAQTPYGHQSMPQYAAQQRPPPPAAYGQAPPPPSTPNARYPYQPQSFPHQQSPPTHGNYGPYTNGRAAIPQRTMSPQVAPRQNYASPAVNVQHNQRYGVTSQSPGPPMNRYASGGGGAGGAGQVGTQSQSPGLVGYHTVIPESQQQRILEQAKARIAAHERSTAMLAQPGISGLAGLSYNSTLDANRLAAARPGMAAPAKPQTPTGQKPGVNGGGSAPAHVPHKVTPVPVPVIPGSQRK